MNGKRTVIRTLDIGADKQADYFRLPRVENPAMGVRSIRICLNRLEVFRTQLRALYRASAFGKVAILFPMITSVWEVKECKRICRNVMTELDREGVPYNKDTEIGIMIETPASVLIADALAKEVDFFSVGTNDLTQYILACDRQSDELGRFCDFRHPAVLRAIKMAADAAHAADIRIGICGELAADIGLLNTFLAIGIDELSVPPASVLPLRGDPQDHRKKLHIGMAGVLNSWLLHGLATAHVFYEVQSVQQKQQSMQTYLARSCEIMYKKCNRSGHP